MANPCSSGRWPPLMPNAGRFPEAVATAEKAEQLATTAGLTAVAAKNRQLLELTGPASPIMNLPQQGNESR